MSATMNASTFRKVLGKQSSVANLIAREIIQNSEDASLRLIDGRPVEFSVEFSFSKMEGDKARDLYKQFAIDELLKTAQSIGEDTVGFSNLVDAGALLKDPVLDVLMMSDFGASGLVGDVSELHESSYYNCLFSVGTSANKEAGAGGSYGFGKSAFVNGSQIGTVIAYTKTGPNAEKGSRRLGAVVYWNGHSVGSDRKTGLGVLGNPENEYEWIDKPYEDQQAEEFAKLLGVPEREDGPEGFGTTIIVLFPAIKPEELAPAIMRNWWPAFEGVTPKIKVAVTDYEGVRQLVAPRQDEDLKEIRRAYELATTDQQPQSDYEYKKEIKDSSGRLLGVFAGSADPLTCNLVKLPGSDGRRVRFSRVALMRQPRLVVRYNNYAKGAAYAPYIEGVFVSNSADEEIEKILRACEPPAHDFWWPNDHAEFSEFKRNEKILAGVALEIREGIQKHVDEFRMKIKPPEVEQKTNLKDFGGFLGRLLRTSGTGPDPQPGTDPSFIHYEEGPVLIDSKEGLRFRTVVEAGIPKDAPEEAYSFNVSWSYVVLADEDGNGEELESTVLVLGGPPAFDHKTLTGVLMRGEGVVLQADSEVIVDGMSVKARPKVQAKQLKQVVVSS
jgi:hypothetical protein